MVSTLLKALLAVVIGLGALLLATSAALWPATSRDAAGLDPAGLAFWTALCLVAAGFPVHTPRGSMVNVSFAPIIAVAALGGPTAAGIVALIGTIELRELRFEVPWYGSLYNHAATVIPAVAAGITFQLLAPGSFQTGSLMSLVAVSASGCVYFAANEVLTAIAIALRDAKLFRVLLVGSIKAFGVSLLGLAPVAWLMAEAYRSIGPLSVLVFALPLYTTRTAYASVVEIRDMFTQTVTALASAIDARDPSTKRHSEWVSRIAEDIGRVLGLGEGQLEELKWGGLLHDVGKIGIPDAVLLKAGSLDKEERERMNEHPRKGHDILKGVKKLAPELPIILHHHEWFNGSGYPDRLVGEEIPFLARILHLADAFEAMTRPRPYRLIPLTTAQALAELHAFTGIQFDPRVVAAFEKTEWAKGAVRIDRDEDPADEVSIPMLGQVAALRAKGVTANSSPAEAH